MQSVQARNHAMTPTRAHDGVRMGDCRHGNWCLVPTSSQEKGSRKRTSASIGREDVKYNGSTVKWDAGARASRHVFPLVSIFSGF